jgi:hypothetical protein
MTIFDHINAYLLDDQSQGNEKLASAIVESAQGLFKTASSGQRLAAEQEWYVNERYREGDHWLNFNRTTGQIKRPSKDLKVRRPINLFRKQLRGIKNFITSQKTTWLVSPPDDSPEGMQEAQASGQLLQGYLYDKLDIPQLLYDVLDNAFMKYYGSWEVFWDDDSDDLGLNPEDSFDVYPDPAYRNPRDGAFLFKTAKVTLDRIKSNHRYFPWKSDVQADNKESASEFKDSLERQKGGTDKDSQSDQTSTAIAYQCFLKRSVPNDRPQIWIVAYAGNKLLRCEQLKGLTRFPIPFLFPERTNHRLYGATWAKDMIAPNRTYENAFSQIEDYILKIKPKLLKPQGSSITTVSDATAEVLEYSNSVPDQLKEFMPAGLPATHFRILDVAAALIQDLAGVHEASLGSKPTGANSGLAINALQAGDDMNVDQPKSMLERFLEETGEIMLELIAAHQVSEKNVAFNTGDAYFRTRFMGEAGREALTPGEDIPPETHVVRPSRVRVQMPRLHYQYYLTTMAQIRNGALPPPGQGQPGQAGTMPQPAPASPAPAAAPSPQPAPAPVTQQPPAA